MHPICLFFYTKGQNKLALAKNPVLLSCVQSIQCLINLTALCRLSLSLSLSLSNQSIKDQYLSNTDILFLKVCSNNALMELCSVIVSFLFPENFIFAHNIHGGGIWQFKVDKFRFATKLFYG